MSLIVLVAVVVFIGAAMQRISGMGLGLLSAPVLSIAIDPVVGVLVVNILASANAFMSTLSVRSMVNWRKFALIGSVMIVGVIPGAMLISVVSAAVLQVIVGGVLLSALSLVTLGKRYVPQVRGSAPAVAAGVAGGFMNTIAGVAGPAITVYAQAARWEQRSFAATLQPLFVVSGLLSFGVKLGAGTGDFSSIPVEMWPISLVSMALGIVLASRFAERVPRLWAHRMAIAMASLGAASVLVRGLLTMVAG